MSGSFVADRRLQLIRWGWFSSNLGNFVANCNRRFLIGIIGKKLFVPDIICNCDLIIMIWRDSFGFCLML